MADVYDLGVNICHTLYVIFSYMSGQNLPFAVQHACEHIRFIKHGQPTRRQVMSWIFEAYANVYSAALFGGELSRGNAASAKAGAEGCRTASYLASLR
jgi:hypothetical protein